MRRWAIGLIGLWGLLAAAPLAVAADKLTLGIYRGDDYLLAFIAKDEGFFEKHGLDVTFQFMTANMSLVTGALVGDSLQIGATTIPVVLQADDNGLDIKIIAGATATEPGFHLAAILVRPDLDIKTAKDLEGKTVSVSGLNSFSHILMRRWLADRGADPAKVHFVETPMGQFGDGLTAKKLDAVIPVEPWLSRIQATGQGKLFDNFVDELPPGIRPIIWASNGDYVRAHPAAIAAFRAGLADALKLYRADPEKGEKALEHYITLPPDVLKAMPKPPMVDDVKPEHIKFWVDMMVQQKLLSHPTDPASVLVP